MKRENGPSLSATFKRWNWNFKRQWEEDWENFSFVLAMIWTEAPTKYFVNDDKCLLVIFHMKQQAAFAIYQSVGDKDIINSMIDSIILDSAFCAGTKNR